MTPQERRPCFRHARDAGVKVINVDNVIQEEDYDLVDGIIASDNTQLGYLSGQWVAEHHPDGANILIVHLQTAESCIINVDGFWQGIKENVKNPDAFVEVQVVEGKGATDAAFEVVSDALQAHDNIDVIYAINDTSALGAVQAVEEAGKTGSIDILRKRRRSNRKACNQRRHNGSKLCPEAYIHGIYGSQRGG